MSVTDSTSSVNTFSVNTLSTSPIVSCAILSRAYAVASHAPRRREAEAIALRELGRLLERRDRQIGKRSRELQCLTLRTGGSCMGEPAAHRDVREISLISD